MNEKMFQFIDPNNNDLFSKMDKIEIKQLLSLLEDFNLELRDNLGLNEKFKFGNELEYNKSINPNNIEEEIDKRHSGYKSVNEPSVGMSGGEVVSPILTDTKEIWQSLKDACNIIKKYKGVADSKCGGHNHVGFHYLETKENLFNFVRLWKANENIIYRFGYGESKYPRAKIDMYASPVARFWNYIDLDKIKNLPTNVVLATLMYGTNYEYSHVNPKNFGVNLLKARDIEREIPSNTIEFRYPNGSLNPAVLQNNVNLHAHLLDYSKSLNFDYDLVEKINLQNRDRFSDLKYYNSINIKQALIFADMIFNNNLDKIYFLKQYLKKDGIEESKKLIKK